jgi:hypothetical protein
MIERSRGSHRSIHGRRSMNRWNPDESRPAVERRKHVRTEPEYGMQDRRSLTSNSPRNAQA